MTRLGRIALVTIGLSVTGAIVGAVAGAAAFLLGVLASGRLSDWGLSGAAAMLGAFYGSIGAPLFGWLVLRHVPLGRAIGWTALGTVVGGATGWVFPLVLNPVIGAFGGFIGASLLARIYTSRRKATQELERSTSAGD
jgi:hypothetical protein